MVARQECRAYPPAKQSLNLGINYGWLGDDRVLTFSASSTVELKMGGGLRSEGAEGGLGSGLLFDRFFKAPGELGELRGRAFGA